MADNILTTFTRLRATEPDRLMFRFVDENGQTAGSLTVGELGDAADSVVESLRAWGFSPGDRAMLVYPPSLDFIVAFLGCMAAGVLPVAVYPPNLFNLSKDLANFTAITDNCQPRAALTNSDYDSGRTATMVKGFLDKDSATWPELPWYRTDRLTPASAEVAWYEPQGPDDPAFVQYTSGSTSIPKGVIVSHGSLDYEVRTNAADLSCGPLTRGVFWLPQYHDFGLVCVILSTIAGNSSETVLMSPLTFLLRPQVWFEVMSQTCATHTAAPNFALEFAVRKTTPSQRAGWDLSSLKTIVCGAEPVRWSTVNAFFTAFAATGLQPQALFPAYGLAEHTAGISCGGGGVLRLDPAALGDGKVVPAVDGIPYLGNGPVTKADATVRLINPTTLRPCAPDEVGEIWVDSPTKGLGYWGLAPEVTAETFRARVADEDDPHEYLRTGDLGFFHDGELYVTGRIKDLIIIRGRNVYPVDIEDSLRECHPWVRPGGFAAFGVQGDADDVGEERLVVFVETNRPDPTAVEVDEIIDAVRRTVYTEHQLRCHTIVLGRAGTVRKTTSGKVQRRACRQAFLDGEVANADTTIRFYELSGVAPE